MDYNKVQNLNIKLGLVFKALSIGVNFVVISFLLRVLGRYDYGLWVTVFSLVNWIFNFDLGIGHGLRNQLTKSLNSKYASDNSEIITNGFASLSIIAIVFLSFGLFTVHFVDISSLLNYQPKENASLTAFVIITLVFTCINFVLSIYKKLYLSIHKTYVPEMVNLFFLTTFLLSLLVVDFFGCSSILALSILYGLLMLLISLITLGFFFRKRSEIKMRYNLVSWSSVKSLFKVSKAFLVINVCLLLILSTDNIIIANRLGPEHVTNYSLVQRVFQQIIMLFSVLLTTSWGLYIQAYHANNYSWIKNNLTKLMVYSFILIIPLVVIILSFPLLLKLWLPHTSLVIPNNLLIANAFYTFLFCFSNVFFYFVNAIQRVNLQMYLYVFGAIINIPLSIFLIDLVESSVGVIYGTILCTLPLAIVIPIQAITILRSATKK